MTNDQGAEPSGSAKESSSVSLEQDVTGKISNDKPPPSPTVQSSPSKSPAAKKGSGVRCLVCRKKIGIVCRYQCRCGLTFCTLHRFPETHSCTFDYKEEGRDKIRRDNPVIVAPKILAI